MAGTQGSSYSSSSKAAAGNKATTQNLQKGLNASGSVKTNSGLGNKPASSSVNAAAAAAARTAAARAATASTQRTQNSGGGIPTRTMAANYGAYKNPAATRMDSYNANARDGSAGVPAQEAIAKGKSGISASLNPQESAYQGKGGFNPPQTSISASINDSLNSVLSRFGQMAATPFGASPLKSPVGNGLAQYDALASLSAPYAASPAAIVAGGATPAMSGDFSKTWGFNGEMYANPTATASGLVGQGMVKAPDKLITDRVAPKAITDRMKEFSQMAQYAAPGSVSPAAREPVGYAPMQTLQNQNFGPRSSTTMAQAQADDMEAQAIADAISGRGYTVEDVPNLPTRRDYNGDVGGFRAAPASPYSGDIGGFRSALPATSAFSDAGIRKTVTPGANPSVNSLTSPMAGQGVSFSNNRYSMPVAGYNQEVIRNLANQRAVEAGLLGYGGTDTFGKYAPGQVAEAPASAANPSATTGYGIYDQPPTRFQKFKASVEKKGDWVNGLLGGTSQNQPGWTAPGDINARDPLNNLPPKERAKVVTEAGKAATDPEFKALPDADKAKVIELLKTGMTLKDALKAIKTGTTTPPTRPTYRYPQYYSTWAGLPSGQTYG